MVSPIDFSLDGLVPHEVFSPQNPQDLAAALAECNKTRRAVVPWGGGTLQHLGSAPARYDVAICTSGLNRVVAYAYDDLTITVEAGMTVDAVAETLAEHNQFLPMDVPLSARATIGGVVAAGVNGGLRLHYGPARDYLLGCRFATVDGKIIKGGSRVVKNVAGYEIHKIQVGALGTLGILTELTFKVFPKPQADLVVWGSFDDLAAACASVTRVWNLPASPLAIELMTAACAERLDLPVDGEWVVAARFGGSAAAVSGAQATAKDVLASAGAHQGGTVPSASIWGGVADLPASLRTIQPDAVLVRASVPPRALHDAVRAFAGLNKTEGSGSSPLVAHAASAIIYGLVSAGENQMQARLVELRTRVRELDGHLIIESAPQAIKTALGAFQVNEASLRLMKSIKQKFDPENILNPGRFVGGI